MPASHRRPARVLEELRDLLGIVREPDISEERLTLRSGDSLVLYTDGVVEAGPTDGALATERLEELLRTCDGRDAGRSRRPSSARRRPSRTGGCATT